MSRRESSVERHTIKRSEVVVWTIFEILNKEPLEWLLEWDFISRKKAQEYIRSFCQGKRTVCVRRKIKLPRFHSINLYKSVRYSKISVLRVRQQGDALRDDVRWNKKIQQSC